MIQDESTESPAEEPVIPEVFPSGAAPKQTHVVHQWQYTSPFLSSRFHPAGNHVFAGCEDNTVQRYEIATGTNVEFAAHDSWVRSFAFDAAAETVVTGGYDGRLIWWPALADEPKPQRTVEAHNGWIRYVETNQDRTKIASVGDDKAVKLWDIAEGRPISEFSGHEKNVYSVMFHPDGVHVLSGDLAGIVKQWEIETGNLVREFDAKALHSYNGGQRVDFGGVRSMAISPDLKYLACSGLHKASNPLGAVHDPIVLLFDWESQELVGSYLAEGLKGVIWRVMFHPDGFMIGGSGGSSGGHLVFWSVGAEKDFHRLKLPHLIRDLDLHHDQLQLATPHYDKHLRISKMVTAPAAEQEG